MEFIFLPVIFPYFNSICVSFSRSLSAPCFLTHACVDRQLVTGRFPSYLSLQTLKLSLKKMPVLGEKSSSLRPAEQCSPQLRTPPTFFQYKRRQDACKKKKLLKSSQSAGCDVHQQPWGSILHVRTVHFNVFWSFKLCYAIFHWAAHAIWHVAFRLPYTYTSLGFILRSMN